MSEPVITLWYNADDPAGEVVRLGRELYSKQGEERISLAEDSLALYLGSTRHNLRGSNSNPLGLVDVLTDAGVENGIQSIVDTKVNTILKNRVRPMFVTDGADTDTKQRAEAMQRACDGVMYEQKLQARKLRGVAMSGYIFEGGGIEWYADCANSRIVATPVWCWNFFVSKREAQHGEPRQKFTRQLIDRGVLLSFLANAPTRVREAVKQAQAASWRDTNDDMRDASKLSDQVVIYKAWHLPSGRVDLDDPRAWGKSEDGTRSVKANHDGRHVVALDGGDDGEAIELVDVPWPHDHFPVAWFKPNFVPGSYWGRGEPEILATAQIEVNRWNTRINQIIRKHAVPRTFVSKESGLNPASMNNNPDNIYQVKGSASTAVQVENVPAVPTDLLQRTSMLMQWMRDQRGVSEMSLKAQKPAGINHEPGMAFLADTESMRHTDEFQAWEEFHIDCYRNIIRCFDELAENDPNYEVVFERDEMLIREKWRNIRLSNYFMMKLAPTNLFKQDPAQRADQISDLVEKGLLPPESYFDAIDTPDLKALIGNRAAMKRNIERCLTSIVKSGTVTELEQPHPYMDLQAAKMLGIQRLNELQVDEPENWRSVNALTQWLELVDETIQQGTAAGNQAPAGANVQALAPGAAVPPPQAGGAPPPQPNMPPPQGPQ